MSGYVYIMINASLPTNTLKIGITKRYPEERAKELSTSSGLLSDYIVAYDRRVNDCKLAEERIYAKLNGCRVTRHRNDRSREFFRLKLRNAIKVIDEIVDEIGDNRPIGDENELSDLEKYMKGGWRKYYKHKEKKFGDDDPLDRERSDLEKYLRRNGQTH